MWIALTEWSQTHITWDEHMGIQEMILRATLVRTQAFSLDNLGYKNQPLNEMNEPRDSLELPSSR